MCEIRDVKAFTGYLESERTSFETFLMKREGGLDLLLRGGPQGIAGAYRSIAVELAWNAWQARAAQPREPNVEKEEPTRTPLPLS
jgi:hypothetical protein